MVVIAADRSPALPWPRTTLVGRAREVAIARALLIDESVPLLTLTGPGGVGKTRLAFAIAEALLADFADGVVFVDLSPIRDPALVLPEIALAVGVREAGNLPLADVLAGYLRTRQLLLVLDNCEQVLPAAGQVADLLTSAPALQVLATSRAPLGIRAEHVLSVPPLALPEAGGMPNAADLAHVEAAALFVARARATDAGFALTDQNAAAVAEICRRLDGLPLALELAAARSRFLSPSALLALLSHRLRLLTGGPRDAPARQRTLRDTIAWSYGLLDPETQRLFARLSVFTGGFTFSAATAVTGSSGAKEIDVLEGVRRLTDTSLLRQAKSSTDVPRFGMLETVREYGLEQLEASGEETAIRDRHAAWCLHQVEADWPPRRPAPTDVGALRRLDDERDNVRVAFAWATTRNDAETSLRLAGALTGFWWMRGEFTEGRVWLERALNIEGNLPQLRAAALYGAAGLARNQGEFITALSQGEESLALAQAHGDRLDVIRARFVLSLVTSNLGSTAQAATHAEAAAAVAGEIEDIIWHAYTTYLVGEAIHDLGDTRRAVSLHEEAIRLFATVGDRWGENNATFSLAFDMHALGELERASVLYRRSLDLSQEIDSPWSLVQVMVCLAALAVTAGNAPPAVRLLGAAEAMRESMGFTFVAEGRALQDRTLAAARDQLGAEDFAAAWEAGQSLRPDQAVAEAHALALEPLAPMEQSVSPAPVSLRSRTVGLSPRELEVLDLIVQRYTAAEIAEQLFVSPRTIESHVSSIYNKLGVNSRRGAAAAAARLGLV